MKPYKNRNLFEYQTYNDEFACVVSNILKAVKIELQKESTPHKKNYEDSRKAVTKYSSFLKWLDVFNLIADG